MVDNEILRDNAYEQLGKNIFCSKWMTMLAVCLVVSAITGFFADIDYVGWIGVLIVTGPLSYGLARVAVGLVETGKIKFEALFHGFSHGFLKTLFLGILQTLFLALWTLLFIVPGIVKSYSYAMCYYIQQENGGLEKEPIDCITESRRMMDGFKWRLFCLDCSFIGWYILGAICFGVGIFFVMPYHEAARANFYEALKAERMLSLTETFVKCPSCGNENKEDWTFCSNCGAKLRQDTVCEVCGKTFEGNYCPNCGTAKKQDLVTEEKVEKND